MQKRSRTVPELEAILETQLRQLERSCDAFDEGHEDEAQRIALIIRKLVHNTKKQISLLTRLGRENSQFVDLCMPRTGREREPFAGLVLIEVEGNNSAQRYIAALDMNLADGHPKPFIEWWEATVMDDGLGVALHRKRLILVVADKDGGAHVDDLEEDFARVSEDNSLGWNIAALPEGIENSAVYASVRQIGHEVLKSLKHGYTKTRASNFRTFFILSAPRNLRMKATIWNPPTKESDVGPGFGISMQIYPAFNVCPSRNDACPCGSKIKYKLCHGKLS